MRVLLLLGVVAFAAFAAGWFQIHREGDSTTIQINRAEIRNDARAAIDKGREILDKREAELQARQAEQDRGGYANVEPGDYAPASYNDSRYDEGQRYQQGSYEQRPYDRRFDDYGSYRPATDPNANDDSRRQRYSTDRVYQSPNNAPVYGEAKPVYGEAKPAYGEAAPVYNTDRYARPLGDDRYKYDSRR